MTTPTTAAGRSCDPVEKKLLARLGYLPDGYESDLNGSGFRFRIIFQSERKQTFDEALADACAAAERENARLRAVLEEIASEDAPEPKDAVARHMAALARAALTPSESVPTDGK